MNITLEWLRSQPSEIVSHGREYRLNCPICGDTNKHLYVSIYSSLYYCFKCGIGGKVQNAKDDMPNLEKYTREHGDIKFNLERALTPKLIKSLPLNCSISEESSAEKYLHSRGITQDEIFKYNIRSSIEEHGPYKNSIIFPI